MPSEPAKTLRKRKNPFAEEIRRAPKKIPANAPPPDTSLAKIFDSFRGPISDIKKGFGSLNAITQLTSDKEKGPRLTFVFFDAADLAFAREKPKEVTNDAGVTIPVDYAVRERPNDLLKADDFVPNNL